jgi:hypothetical protein
LKCFLGGKKGYVAEKSETERLALPGRHEVVGLVIPTCLRICSMREKSQLKPSDGYIVNEIIDSCFRSAKSKWEPVRLKTWHGREKAERINAIPVMTEKIFLSRRSTWTDP